MAMGVLFDIPGWGEQEYESVLERLTGGRGLNALSDWPVEGVLAHVAGPTENGWRVVDVWESEEAFGRFGETLMPIIQELGTDLRPDVFPVHNFVKD